MPAFGEAAFVAATAATCFQSGVQWYTQVSTYPLFRDLPDAGFAAYHRAYEQRLPLAIYAPYGLLMASLLPSLVRPPQGVSRAPIAAASLLNISIMVTSVALAAPIHAGLDRGEVARVDGVRRLLRMNALRLAASMTSSGIMLAMLRRRLVTRAV